jgi:hypothetical protein
VRRQDELVLPYWIQVLQALLTPAIAAIAVMIALFQWRTAQQKVVLDLFDRRMETYTALRTVVAKVMASSSAETLQTSFEFLQALDRADFLFGNEVIEHLKKIDNAIQEIRMTVAEAKDLSPGPQLTANVAMERSARDTVGSFYTTLQPLVKPYIRMHQKTTWWPCG